MQKLKLLFHVSSSCTLCTIHSCALFSLSMCLVICLLLLQMVMEMEDEEEEEVALVVVEEEVALVEGMETVSYKS